MGLRHLGEWNSMRDFSGFKDKRTNMRKIISQAKPRCMREAIAMILHKQDQLFEENRELKAKCCELEETVKVNNEMRSTLEGIKKN
ncbi:hypothetical protein E2C01_023571 [Portunus trituberculatus]|uniref:Uncharacterized protein n=1 Tax=Portunus trituberculatus TaxID=210409 RepID=A0A5B7E8A2_PORTR|nr:hypothetical protein [Portunus trituberculatus]